MPVGKSRQLTDFEKNLKEEIYKRDNHIDNSVKYAIDTGQDYGVSKDTPQWRRDAINKYRDSHKVEIYDDNGNLVGTVGYEAHKAINKNKVFDYKGKNDEEKKVFSYLRQRQNRESRKKEQREYVKNHMSNPEIEKLKFDYNPKTSMSRDEYNAERQRRKDNKDAASNTGKVEFFDFRDTKTARERLNSQSLPEFVDFRDVKSATEKLKKQNTEQLPEFGSYKYYENQADEKAKELEEIDKYINDNYSLDDINIWQNAKEGVRDAGENAVKYNSDEKLKGIDNLMSRKADILDDYVGAVACLEAYEGRALKFKEDGSVDTDNVRFVSGNQKKRYEVMEKYGGSPAPEYMKTPRQPNEELNGELAAAKGEEEKQTVLKKIDRYQKDMLDPTLNKITETVDKSKKNVAVLNDNIDAANYYDKNKDNKYGDGVFGRIAGNYRIGDIGEERAMSAFNSYAYSDSDLTATQIYDELSRRIQERNKDTFTNTKAWQQNLATIAQYVPQGRNQAIARLKGAAVGSVIPLVGSKTGGDAAAAMYMFKQTAGNMYADLILEEGLSPEEAKKLSANNALWSGVVEYGLESALGGVLKGIGKGVKKIAPTEKVIKVLEKTGLSEEAAKKAVSAAKTAGNYAVGIFGEGAEEWIQQGGEIVTKRYAAKGESASALKIAAETFDFSKYTDEDFDEMNEAFKGGAVIGFASTVGSRAAVNLAQSGMDKLAAHSDNKAVGKAALTVSQPDVLINRAIDAGLESSDEKTVGRIQKLADKYKSGNASAAEVGEIIKTGLRTGYEQEQNLKVTEDTQTNDDVALPTQDSARQSVLAAANSGNSESSVISPSVTAAANVSERQMHDVKENLSEGGAAQSVEQVQNAVKKVTNTMINEFKNSNIKNIPDYQAAYNENLRLSTTKGATIDKDFIKTYANQYAEGLKRNNSKAYKELASVSDDVGSMLTDYLISNRIPQGIGDISALAQAGGELRSIVGKAAQTTLAMNGKIYNDTDRVSAISNEIANGNFAVVDGANDGNIALAKVGEYYEAYGADAVALAKAFNVSTHYIQKNGRKTLVAAVPSKYIGEYAAKLGYSGTQYSAGGNEYIYLTKDAERGNLSADAVRSDITAESDSDFIAEIEKNGMIELDERPSESKIETIAAQVERDNTIPVYLDGVDKLGEVLLVYANEEDVTRNMVKTDINSYYDGVMPERGIPLSENTDRHYDEDTIEISERPSEYDADSYALVVELDRTIPILLNGVDELGEVELNYSNEENVTRDMVKSDIDAYYSGTMPERGVSLSNNYDPDIKFSVESVDGTDKKYVKADRQVISGDNPEEWRKQVYNYINSSIRKGKDINVLSADGDVLTITEDTAGKARFRNTIREPNGNLRKMTNEEFAVKLRAESHIDEIAEVSKKNGYSAIDTKNHHFAKDGFYYRTAYFEDFDGKYYKLTLSVGKSGEINTVYNVGKLKETYGRARDSKVVEQKPNNARRGFSDEAVPFKTASETNIGLRGGTPSNDTTISQNDDVVNSNIRENSENDTVSNAKSAENHFGTTNDFKEAGYITVNGQMLDFSGRHWGGTENGMRTVDHGDIAEDENISYFKDGKLSGADAVQRFLDDGNIRILDERGGINLSVAPNAAQTDVLKDFINSKNGDVIIDITDERGLPKQNFEYGKGTSAQKIISDINSYFDNGTVPQISELNKFRYSLDGGGIIRYNDDIDIPYRESKQLREYIMSENNQNGSRLKPFDKKEIGDNFYVWRNNSKTDYDVIAQVEIDGNEDIIDLLRKGLENGETYGIDKGAKGFNDWLTAVRSGQRSDNSNNAVDTAELSNGNDDRLYSRQSSDDDGIKFAREGGRNQQNTEVGNYGRDDILNGNDRRTLGESERERGSSVPEITGNAEENAGEEQSSASSRRIYARDVKEAGGVERRNDRGVEADFVKSEYYNDEMRRIAAENDERGVVTHFILGNGRAIEYGTNFRGAVRGNEVYIQADHGKYSPTQINRHEIIHRNYSSDTVQELKNRIKSRLTNEQIRDIAERLYRDYAQKRRSFDEIFEEFVCDVMADMNDYAEMFETETREYWAAEEQDRKGYSPSTYTESIDAGGKNVAENKGQQWSQSRGLQLPKLADTITDNTNISQNDNVVNSDIRKNSENDTLINTEDVKAVQSIPKKSVNDFTSEEIEKTENFAKRYYSEMGEKSPFFRAWFGDWRANDTSEVAVADKKGAVRGTTKNLDTGWDIQISGKVFNETKSHSSSHAKEAFPYLDYINSIVENAVLLDSYTVPSGKAKSSNSAMMHSLYAIADMGNGRELVKLYVEELNDVNSDGTIKRAYQLQNITKAPAASVRVQNNILSSLTNTASADTYTVSQLFNIVKSLDKNFKPNEASKVVNTDGTPKVVYHGTDNFGFTVFDTAKSDDNSTLFFTDSKDIASTYSGKEGVTQLGDESNTKYGDTPNDIVKGLNEVRSADDEFAGQRYFYLDKDGVDKINAEIDRDAYALMEYLDNYDFSNEKENVKSTAIKLDEKLNNLEYDSISTPLYMLLHHSAVFGDEKSARRFAKLEKNVRLINEIKKNRKSDVIVGEGLNGYSFYIYGIDAAKDILSKKLKMGIYSVYLNMQNPYIVDCDGKNWNDITYYEIIPDELKKFYKNGLWRHGTTREAAAYAKNEGFDGVIFENVTDNGGNNSNIENKPVNVYVAFDSNQIKSATDNIGTFDKANNDIRFSTDENTDVNAFDDEDMSYLSEPVRNIRNDINEVINRADLKKGGKVYDRAAAVRVRDSILDNISIGDIQGIDMRTKKDRAVMTVLVNRALNSAGVDAKRKSARDLTRYIAQNASVYDADSLCADGGVDYEGDRAVILNYIKHGVKISPDAKEAIISAVGENSARGYIAMMSNNSALGIDSVYDELSVALPGYFASDALTEGEKMRRVIDVYTWLKDGKSMQDVKLIDVMTPDDARAFTELVQKQLELAFDTMGRDSAISREIAAERTKYEQRLSDIREKYEAKIADMRNSAKKKQSDGAKAKNISTEQTGNRFKNLAEAAKKYGAIKKGANAVRDIEMPKRIDDNRYVSRFARTMAEAGVTPDESLSEFERDILDGKMTYERITDEEAKKSATDKIMRRGFMQALDDWNEMILSNQRIGKNEMALGQTLYNQCINAKDAQNAMKIAADLANIATQAGQTVQACALIKQMSPDCQLYSLEQSVEKMKREFENKRKFVSGEKRKIDLKINEELAQKLLNAKTEDERRAVMDEILQDIANQIPSTLKDKWDSWRYLSMLGNPRTHIRNIGGNAVFMLPVKVKNAVGWVLEKTISKDKRTKSLKSTKDSKNFAAADYAKMKDIIQGSSGKYEELSKINELRRIYKFKPLEWLRKANFAALEWEDGIFLKHHYVNAMAQFLTARGYTSEFMNSGTKDAASVLENARAYAMSEAQKATYRDANAIAETLSRWQRNLQNNDKLGVRVVGQAVEGIVPFKKTPLNIAKRGVEYSPIGLISGLYDAAANIKSGKVTAAQAIDKIASGLTGTGLVILGMGLSKLGLVRGDDDDDDKLARLDSATGEQSYSFKIGNHSYTIDWVAPASMPFFMGVSMWNAFEKTDKFTFEEILNAVLKIPAPLLNLSVLSSLNDLIRAGDYSSTPTEKMADYAWQATTSYVGQAFPTVMGQITRTVDKTKRNASFTDPDNGLPAGLDRFIARQVTKIPGLSKILEPKIDMWGREETYGDTWYGRLIGNTISPGYYKEINSTALDDELRRLGNEYEGDGSVLPPKAPKYFTYEKQKYYMTPSEYAQYSVIRGQKSFEYADELIRTDDYKNKSAEEKKKALEKCYDAAGDEAKNEILKGRGIDVAAKEAEKAAKKKSKKKTSKKKKK